MTNTEDISHIRHSLSHLLAAAVLELYPHAKPTLGPATDTGFYYDFDLSDGDGISEDDLPKIEDKMREILKTWSDFEESEVSHDEAVTRFENNPYKLELINELAEHNERITLYTSGTFTDLCRGGHVEDAQSIDPQAFTLTSVAGAYWRGDENNQMLTRIYGTAFHTPDELAEHKQKLEEAKARDHRKLGKELDLFTFSDLIGPGLPLYTPRGQAIKDAVTGYLERVSAKYGYDKVAIPHLAKLDLYQTSGHAEKFEDEFFYVHGQQSGDDFVLKPMNCPHHTQIYASKPRSYRDLPVRFSEITAMYRDEKPGELLGLSRTRAINVDDAHIFCTPDQIKQEADNIVEIFEQFYTAFDLWHKDDTFWVSLSVRDPETPEKYLGDDQNWQKAEQFLQDISDERELDAVRQEGEAAFYGPKLDFMFTDALGRETQLATVQIDFVMPERFGLEYKDADGQTKAPVMIHRAVAGSFERFLVILIEHFAGAFPAWLAPEQARVLPVNPDNHHEYAHSVTAQLKSSGVRAELDATNESLGKRIRAAKTAKVPYLLVVGDNEIENESVNVESRDEGDLGGMSIQKIAEKISGQ